MDTNCFFPKSLSQESLSTYRYQLQSRTYVKQCNKLVSEDP